MRRGPSPSRSFGGLLRAGEVLDALHHDAAHERGDLRHALAGLLRPDEAGDGRAAVAHRLAGDERDVARRLVDAAGVLGQVVAGRGERPGAMFADMELIGLPHVVVIGDRNIDEGVFEYKNRRTGEKQNIPFDDIINFLTASN